MPPTPSISPALNSVTSSISFSASRPARCSDATGFVKAPSSGVAKTSSTALADSALAQVPVGEERELERRDRALDRHVDEVHDEPAAVEVLERSLQRRGALGS